MKIDHRGGHKSRVKRNSAILPFVRTVISVFNHSFHMERELGRNKFTYYYKTQTSITETITKSYMGLFFEDASQLSVRSFL